MRSCWLVSAAAVGLGLLCSSPVSRAVDRTWDDGDPNNSFWDSNQNWSDDTQPGPADKAIVGGNPEVNTLEIFSELENSGTIDISTGTLQPTSGTVNTGTINVGDGSAIVSQFNPGGSSTISGGGEVVLQNSDNILSSRAILTGGANSGVPVTNGANHTIRGEGNILLHWVNDGIVQAEETTGDSSAVLLLDGGSFVNNGELRSSSGASITLSFLAYSQGVSGQLIADSDNILLTGVTSLTGGSLESVGGGVFDANGLLTFSGVTVNAPIDNSNTGTDGRLFVDSGGITNNSTITLDGQVGSSQFGFTSSGTVDGTGEVVLVGGDSSTLVGVFPGVAAEFTQGASHTIRGAGVIGSRITNNGTIRAEPGTNGSILLLNSQQTNNGLMEAGAGATLEFQSGVSVTSQGASGLIRAADGGTVVFENTTITGGSFESSGSGRFLVTVTSRVSDVTSSADIDLEGAFVRLIVDSGGLTNNGQIRLNSNNASFGSALQFSDDALLDGTGEVLLNATGGTSALENAAGADVVVTQGAGHTVRGDGSITVDIVNNGRIEGESPTDPVSLRSRVSGVGTLKDVSFDFTLTSTIHAPGSGVGIGPIEGSYALTHPNVRLEIEVGGLAPGTDHDQLDGSGDPNSAFSLGGTLDVLALDSGGYTPTAGDRFQIIQSSNPISGTFSSVNFPDVLGGRFVTWQPVDYATDPNAVSLEIATVDFFDADFDMDGDVDNDDLTEWQLAYGSSAGGDANGDGRSDGLDFLVWQEQFGLGVSPLAAVATAVPEPETLVLFLLGCLLGGKCRR